MVKGDRKERDSNVTLFFFFYIISHRDMAHLIQICLESGQ